MAAIIGSLVFIIPAGFFVRWAIRKKKRDKKKAAKVIQFDDTEAFYSK